MWMERAETPAEAGAGSGVRSVSCQVNLPVFSPEGGTGPAEWSGGSGLEEQALLARLRSARTLLEQHQQRLPEQKQLPPEQPPPLAVPSARPAVVAPCQPRAFRPAAGVRPPTPPLVDGVPQSSNYCWGSPSPPGTPPGAAPLPIVRLESLLSLDGSWGGSCAPGTGETVAWTFLPSSIFPGPAPLPGLPSTPAPAPAPAPAKGRSSPLFEVGDVPDGLRRSMLAQNRHLLRIFARLQQRQLARAPSPPRRPRNVSHVGGRALKGFWKQL